MSEEYRQKLDARLKRLMGRSGPPIRPEDKEVAEAFSAAGKRFRSFWKSLIAKVEGTSEAVKRLEAAPAGENRAAGEADPTGGWEWAGIGRAWRRRGSGESKEVAHGGAACKILDDLLKAGPGKLVTHIGGQDIGKLSGKINKNCESLGLKIKVKSTTQRRVTGFVWVKSEGIKKG